ncbi:MAG: glycosyltransferase family 1 protein [Homoserinimonas sp.]
MTTLRVVVDHIVAPVPGGVGRYTEELTRQLIALAPPDCDVAGLVSASSDEDYDRLRMLLPGLADLVALPLDRRNLRRAWQAGITSVPGTTMTDKGMVHAPSLLAPLGKHDRLNEVGNQTVVTIHDVAPWTHPDALSPRKVAWHKAMAKRSRRYADAVVVPTHAVAAELDDIMGFGERIRVIGGAVSPKLTTPVDADARAERLELPERYILSVGTLEPRKGLEPLIRSLAHADSADLPLLIAGPSGWGDLDVASIAADAGLEPGRVRTVGFLPDADLAVALDRATVFAFPSIAEGFGLPVIEALSFGTPVVHSDTPAVVEVAAGAGVTVPREDPAGYPERLAQAIASVANDATLAERLRFQGLDRSGAFSWQDSAEKVWQLHADL